MTSKTLFEQFRERKASGEILNFDNITYDELYQIWWEESVSDSNIAELFNVPKSRVTRKRDSWEMKFHSCCIKSFLKSSNF